MHQNSGILTRGCKSQLQSEWPSRVHRQPTRRHPRHLLRFLHQEVKPILLLVTLGVSASLVDFFIETAVLGLELVRQQFLQPMYIGDSTLAEYAVWSAFTIFVATAAVVWTHVLDPVAAGSGIPEMKSIISFDLCDEANRYLRARTLLSKIGGLTLAMGSGMSVGKEGPFVHTSSIIAHRLMKHVSWFRRFYTSDILRQHLYDAACAVGVASTFRAPIGGVLFSIEATSTVFMVSNYWRALVAAMSASLARHAVNLVRQPEIVTYHPMFPTVFQVGSFAYVEIAAFALLAVLTGFLGVLYVSVSVPFKRRWKAWTADKPVVLAAWTLLFPLSVVLSIPVGLGHLSCWDLLTDLTSPASMLPERWHTELSLPVLLVLPLAGLLRLLATTLSTALPVPAGEFLPTFVAGAMFGRFFGQVLQLCCPASGVIPGGYALVGGAGLVASVTHTASIAVIALEFTGQFVYTIPLLLSTLLASGIGCALSVSIYDSVIVDKGFDHFSTRNLEDVKTRDVMLLEFPVLTLEMTREQMQHVLDREASPTLPLVDNLDAMLFYGCVPRSTIQYFARLAGDDRTSSQRPVHLLSALQMPSPVADAVPITLANQVKDDDERRSSASTVTTTEEVSQTESSVSSDTTASRVSDASSSEPRPSEVSLGSLADSLDDAVALDMDGCARETPPSLAEASVAVNPIHHSLVIDATVLQVDPDASLQKVHLLFEMIKCPRIWVTRRGRLVGLLHRHHLHARVAELSRKDPLA